MNDATKTTAGLSGAVDEAIVQFRLAWPIALTQFAWMSVSLVDTAFVGRVSRVDLAAVSLGRSLVFAISSISLGTASAIEPLASQALGRGQAGRAWWALDRTIRAIALLSGPSVMATLALTWWLPWAGVPIAVVERTRTFLVSQVPSQVTMMVFFAGKSFLQAHGITRPTLVGAAAANVVNVVMCAAIVRGDDSLLALGLRPMGLPRLGAVGAGIASDMASLFMMSAVLIAARNFRVRSQRDSDMTARAVLRLGVPLGLQLAAEIGVFSLAAVLAGRLGEVSLSAHQVALGLAGFTFMGPWGISGATAVRVGYAVGAGRSPRRQGLVGIGLGLTAMVASAIAFAAIPAPFVRIFTTDPLVVAAAVPLVRVAAAFQLFDGMQTVAAGALRGAGDVRLPFLANVLSHWFVGLPISVVLAFEFHLGTVGLWLGLTAGLISVALTLGARFAVLSGRRIEAL
jgi:MATE family multidrug resistance protein